MPGLMLITPAPGGRFLGCAEKWPLYAMKQAVCTEVATWASAQPSNDPLHVLYHGLAVVGDGEHMIGKQSCCRVGWSDKL